MRLACWTSCSRSYRLCLEPGVWWQRFAWMLLASLILELENISLLKELYWTTTKTGNAPLQNQLEKSKVYLSSILLYFWYCSHVSKKSHSLLQYATGYNDFSWVPLPCEIVQYKNSLINIHVLVKGEHEDIKRKKKCCEHILPRHLSKSTPLTSCTEANDETALRSGWWKICLWLSSNF